MLLTSEQIESITSGTERLTAEENGLRFWRFTPAQQEMYQLRSGLGMHNMTAGVRLCMRTDSTTLTLRVLVLAYYVNFASFSFDIHVNGRPVGHLDCFISEQITGVHEKVFDLGTGLKTVDIYFPFSVHVLLQQLALDDGAFWQPVIRSKKLLAYGDSITQGYRALRPADTYVHRLADALCAQCLNKGVGGDLTFPELAASEEPFCPDYITIAYGTNDLGSRTKAEFSAAYHRFLEEVVGHFPTARIFAISPIWRSDHGNNWPIGSFEDMDRVIQTLCAQFQTVTYVSGISLIPGSAEYFQDKWVHPSSEGFAHYARNLLEMIRNRERVL